MVGYSRRSLRRPGLASLAPLLALTVAWQPAAAQAAPTAEQRRGRAPTLYTGMWTMHLADPGRGVDQNWLLGLSWAGYYGATFVNSFGDRAFAVGREGPQRNARPLGLDASLGLRMGVVTGYDERFLSIAGKAPVLPLVQVHGGVRRRRTAVELSWTVMVVSVSLGHRF